MKPHDSNKSGDIQEKPPDKFEQEKTKRSREEANTVGVTYERTIDFSVKRTSLALVLIFLIIILLLILIIIFIIKYPKLTRDIIGRLLLI